MDHAALADYLRALADRLALKDWRIYVATGAPADADALAEVTIAEGQRRATVRVREDFFSMPPDEQRHVAVHELVHCHLHATHRAIESVQTNLGDCAWGVLEDLHRLAVENATDAIADAVAPLMPLPPGGKTLTHAIDVPAAPKQEAA